MLFAARSSTEEKNMNAGVTKIGAAAAEERSQPGKETLKREFLDSLFYMQGKFPALATRRDYYMAWPIWCEISCYIAGSAPRKPIRGSNRAPLPTFPRNS